MAPAGQDQATGEADMVCTSCGEEAPAGATWCEACGHELAVAATEPCTSCGERVVSPEGYCLSCGQRQPRERDHVRLTDGSVAAVSDRGRRHHHNEDSVVIAEVAGAGGTAVLVVCDGVSSTPGSAEASAAAASTAGHELIAGLGSDPDRGEPGSIDVVELLTGAVAQAQRQVTAADNDGQSGDGAGPPSSTLVAVVVRPEPDGPDIELVTAWVGDSRAYWITADGGRQLTGDDHELGGSLIRWLGADSVDPTPELARQTVRGPGQLVVCSDGLWRYAAEPDDLADLVNHLAGQGLSGIDLAEALVAHANQQGGHDNISVALWGTRKGDDDR